MPLSFASSEYGTKYIYSNCTYCYQIFFNTFRNTLVKDTCFVKYLRVDVLSASFESLAFQQTCAVLLPKTDTLRFIPFLEENTLLPLTSIFVQANLYGYWFGATFSFMAESKLYKRCGITPGFHDWIIFSYVVEITTNSKYLRNLITIPIADFDSGWQLLIRIFYTWFL